MDLWWPESCTGLTGIIISNANLSVDRSFNDKQF